MQADMPMKHVVIDGSNIATEGRDAPSLAQLDEAVRAFIEEYSPEIVTVVVDATFPNRIEASERQTYEDAVAANELITPPAGAIGRGDAFVLQIARRADAAILSNDSFQEFHGDYPWLFEPGRLIGGKPVPHVGWVFMERVPVRGPASRRSVSEARKAIKATKVSKASKAATAAQAPAAAKAARPAAKAGGKKRRPSGGGPAGDGTGVAEPAGEAAAAALRAPGDGQEDGQREPATNRAAKDVSPYNEALPFIEFIADHPVGSEVEATVERFSSHGAYVVAGDARGYVPLRNLGHPAPRSAREVLNLGEQRRFVVIAVDAPRRGIDMALPGVVAVTAAPAASVEEQVVEALGMVDAPAPATATTARKAKAGGASRKRAAAKKAATKATKAATATKAAAATKAAKAAPAAKRAAKKAPAKATVVKRSAGTAAVEKGAGPAAATKKSPARKAPARKASTKQATAKAPARKATAKAAKKSAAKAAPAKKAPRQ
jgi:Zc3h12a-like Ribonuclease NYN domain/S1 RNA binding domain